MSNEVLSPIPGVFYRRPSPDDDVYVNEGDTVTEGQIIGLVEVMKNFFEVKAEKAGVLKEFRAENEELLEAGQVIAVIE